ncbi:MAG: MgtC/SapB family protein [Chloroflexota bacterium]|nr:MgtC/SapB family protein [Chloroflexota bacterium]
MSLNIQVEIVLRLLLAVGLGAAIGYQRVRAGKTVGIRTHILIAMGSALFTLVSIFGFSCAADTSRVAAGIVTGIGFIGAGVIFRGPRGEELAGLTTAAGIWATAAVGLAAGAGLYILSAVATAIIIGILMLPRIRS